MFYEKEYRIKSSGDMDKDPFSRNKRISITAFKLESIILFKLTTEKKILMSVRWFIPSSWIILRFEPNLFRATESIYYPLWYFVHEIMEEEIFHGLIEILGLGSRLYLFLISLWIIALYSIYIIYYRLKQV